MCKLPASQEEGEDVVALEDKEEEVRLEGEVPLRLKCVLHAAIIAIKHDSATARQRDRDSVTGRASVGGLVYGAPIPTFSSKIGGIEVKIKSAETPP